MIIDPIIQKFIKWYQPEPKKKPDNGNGGPKGAGELGWAYDTLIYRSSQFTPYNPDELLTWKGQDVYKRMMRDEQVKATSRFKRNAVVSRGWYFDVENNPDTGEPKKEHEEIRDYYMAMIKNMTGSIKDMFNNVLTALQNGFSISEKIPEAFEYDGKPYWGIKQVRLLPFYSFNDGFVIDQHGNILELNQIIGAQRIKIPIDKVIYFVHQPDMDVIYGESDLRACYRAWWGKDIVIKFQNIHLERHAGGMMWAQVQEGGEAILTDPVRRGQLESVMKNVTAHTSMIMPPNVKLEMQTPANTDSYERAIAMYDKAISKSMLVPNLLGLSEQGQTGSYSQSQTQLEVFFWVLDDLAERLADVLNEQLFKEQALWNFGTEDFPLFKFEPMSDYQKLETAKLWGELVSKGAVTKSESDEAYTRKLVDYPEQAEIEEPEMPLPGGDIPGLPGEQEPEELPDSPGDELVDGLEEEDKKARNINWVASLPSEHRDEVRLEFIEKPWLNRVDFQRLEKRLDADDKQFLTDLSNTMAKGRISIENQIAKVAAGRSFGNVLPKEVDGTVRLPKGIRSSIGKISRASLKGTLDAHYELARKELPKRKLQNPISPGMDKTKAESFLSSRAMTIQGVVDKDVLEEVKHLLMNAIKYDWSMKMTMDKMRDNARLMALLPDYDAAGRAVNKAARLENIVRTNTSEAMNAARDSMFKSTEMRGFVQAFEYSAVLDSRTTEICTRLHGKVRKEWSEYTPPNHFMCRSLLVPVTAIDNWDGKQGKVPAGVAPHEGFG